jgi:hypothetical protein
MARGKLRERTNVVGGDAELERALLLQCGRKGEEECRDECEDLGQNVETLRKGAP